jgi:hypothetical protein
VVDIQARRAAHSGVTLDTAVGRYAAAHEITWAIALEEIHKVQSDDSGVGLERQAWTATASLFVCLVRTVIQAYTEEIDRQRQTQQGHNRMLVTRLLTGETGIEGTDVDYDLHGHHLGVIATGKNVSAALALLAAGLDCQLLADEREQGMVWAWLGRKTCIAIDDVARCLKQGAYADVRLTVGRSEEGISGIRLTHKQAQAALRVAQLQPRRLTCYADVEPLGFILQDDDLAQSLITTYIEPIVQHRDGPVLLNTLQTFFANAQNRVKTAKALPGDRHTVTSHLKRIEELLGCTLCADQAKVELALKVYELWKSSEYIA